MSEKTEPAREQKKPVIQGYHDFCSGALGDVIVTYDEMGVGQKAVCSSCGVLFDPAIVERESTRRELHRTQES